MTTRSPKARQSEPPALRKLLTGDPPEWMQHGVCTEQIPTVDNDPWFAERGSRAQSELAVRICQSCPSKSECLQFALDGKIEFGTWGGMTAWQRRRMQRAGAVA